MSFVPFIARGFQRDGLRRSPAMLARRPDGARRAAGHAEICALPVSGASTSSPASTIRSTTCRRDELAAAFEGMARNLAPGGMAVFDLNSLLAYRTTFAMDA